MADQVRVRVTVSKEQGKLEETYTGILTTLLKGNWGGWVYSINYIWLVNQGIHWLHELQLKYNSD